MVIFMHVCSCGGRLGITSSSDITKPEPIEGAFGGNSKINARTSLEKHTQYTSLLGPHTIFLSIIITEYGRLDGVDRGVWE